MIDLVERLRRGADDASLDCYAMCEEAADRIDALEKALRFTLEVMEIHSKLDGLDPSHATPSSAIGVARAALTPEQNK